MPLQVEIAGEHVVSGRARKVKRHRVTSREVADRAGVSRTTVSFVLNGVQSGKVSEETRARVLKAARELGYVPDAAARTLVSGKTRTIGLVVSRADHISVDAFIPQTLQGLTRVCMRQGYQLLIETAEDGQTAYDYDQLIGGKRIDGLVVLNPDPRDDRLRTLIEKNYPIALIGAYPHPGVAAVSVDSTSAMDRVTTHLIDQGHTRIGFIHYRRIRTMRSGGRFGGYRAALERAGVPLDPRWIRSGDYSAASGYEAMMSILTEARTPLAPSRRSPNRAFGSRMMSPSSDSMTFPMPAS
jgi:LacI family transcriptional regulator